MFSFSGTSKNLADDVATVGRHLDSSGYEGNTRHDVTAIKHCKLTEPTQRGDIKHVCELLKSGEDPNGTDEYSFTPLLHAAFEGYLHIAKMLIENGAFINRTTYSGGTPLYAASSEGHTDVVIYLLQEGAKVNHRLRDRSTALHAACAEGFTDTAQILHGGGANIHAIDDLGCTPLNYACRNGNIEIVKLLVENGAAVNHRSTKTGFTALHEITSTEDVCHQVRLDICKYLLKHGADIDREDKDGNTCLLHCVRTISRISRNRDDIEILNYLAQNGADVNHRSKNQDTALQESCYYGNFASVKYLVQQGADISIADSQKMTPLHYAADGNFYDITRYLVDKGGDMNVRSRDEQTPLHLACTVMVDDTPFDYYRNYQLITFLVGRGADVNARTRNFGTALHLLVYRLLTIKYEKCEELIKTMSFLLESGCHLDIPDEKGRTVLDYIRYVRTGLMYSKNFEIDDFIEVVAHHLPLPLSCLSATLVCKYNLLTMQENARLFEYFQDIISIHDNSQYK